ncbi:GTPase ObgE [bacterium]|nr:GTPase ObgE [bacterium]
MVAPVNFLDYVELYLKAGYGGDGTVAFLQESHRAKGGPAGGDGGDGGNVIISSDKNIRSLSKFRFVHHLKAASGEHGGGKSKKGKRGEDLVIGVPIGTIIYNEDHEKIYDFTKDKEEVILLKGGKGGFGNARFKSSRMVKPSFALKGEETDEQKYIVELKLLADIALVGFPNAGKSTLISKISNAKPKIANYPFTTLTPHLGIVFLKNGHDFIVADIPGLIEGAHEGKGVGHRFLKHIERCRIMVYLLDPDNKEERNLIKQKQKLENELRAFNKNLVENRSIIAVNKIDLLTEEEIKKLGKQFSETPEFISAKNKINLNKLLYKMDEELQSIPIENTRSDANKKHIVYKKEALVKEVIVKNNVFYIYGKIEKDVKRLNFEQYDTIYFFKRYLKLNGIDKILRKSGIRDGDIVVIGKMEFTYIEED